VTGRSGSPIDRHVGASGMHLRYEWCGCQHGSVTTMDSCYQRALSEMTAPSCCACGRCCSSKTTHWHLKPWRTHAREWFDRFVDDASSATAIGTLSIGVPNPHCPRGRPVRIGNVITLPQCRGCGYGTRLVLDVIDWAKAIEADRVDLSATPEGQCLRQSRFRGDLGPEDETRLVTHCPRRVNGPKLFYPKRLVRRSVGGA